MIEPNKLDNELVFLVVRYAYEAGGFTTRSDYARANAEVVAAASLQSLITTKFPGEGYGSVWRPTNYGIGLLYQKMEGRYP